MKRLVNAVGVMLMVTALTSCLPKGGMRNPPTQIEDENHHKSKIDIILNHQARRFKVLESILRKDAKYRLKFPGKDADHHALGTGIAKKAWETESSEDHKKMVSSIASAIKDLEKEFPNRISFGAIGDFTRNPKTGDCDQNIANAEGFPGLQNDGTFVIHVWGANADNFNYPNGHQGPFGSGQASCFKYQRPGVFGISTMPSDKEEVLMAKDNMMDLY